LTQDCPFVWRSNSVLVLLELGGIGIKTYVICFC
jgi:hypothetical protein